MTCPHKETEVIRSKGKLYIVCKACKQTLGRFPEPRKPPGN